MNYIEELYTNDGSNSGRGQGRFLCKLSFLPRQFKRIFGLGSVLKATDREQVDQGFKDLGYESQSALYEHAGVASVFMGAAASQAIFLSTDYIAKGVDKFARKFK